MSPSIQEGLFPAPPEPTAMIGVRFLVEVRVPQSASAVDRIQALKDVVQTIERDPLVDELRVEEVFLSR